MNVGRAITEAMQLDKLRDELRMMCMCPACHRPRATRIAVDYAAARQRVIARANALPNLHYRP